jgi:hypothetical protein
MLKPWWRPYGLRHAAETSGHSVLWTWMRTSPLNPNPDVEDWFVDCIVGDRTDSPDLDSSGENMIDLIPIRRLYRLKALWRKTGLQSHSKHWLPCKSKEVDQKQELLPLRKRDFTSPHQPHLPLNVTGKTHNSIQCKVTWAVLSVTFSVPRLPTRSKYCRHHRLPGLSHMPFVVNLLVSSSRSRHLFRL